MSALDLAHSCPCCAQLLNAEFNRRHFIKLAGAAGLASTFPLLALGAEGNYEAMVLSCIDPRFPELTLNYMKGRGMLGKYSQFVIAGAGIGVVAPVFKDWHKAFWDNLAASIELHRISKVIVLDHRDCGAARIAYGDAAIANPQIETETHRAALLEFRKQANERQPKLAVETGLLAFDGTVEMFV
jgi:carbonic anhydrase